MELNDPFLFLGLFLPTKMFLSYFSSPFMLSCCPQRLQELHLQENSIEMLAEQALSGLSSLALLDLSRNHLRTLGASSLKPLVSLQVLRVTGMKSYNGLFRTVEELLKSSVRFHTNDI